MRAALHEARCDALTIRGTRCAKSASSMVTEVGDFRNFRILRYNLCRVHRERTPRGLW
jgi:hypothetical protein